MKLESQLESLSLSQKERLAYIDFRLYFLGEAKRLDLTSRFQIAGAAATRDFALYKELAQQNLIFDGGTKSYVISSDFQPVFIHTLERTISALAHGFGDGLSHQDFPLVPCESPSILNRPNLDTLAAVTRAIHLNKPLSLQYCSISSSTTTREIVPCGLVDSGLRWHVRAYDRKNKAFRDFVLTRMANVVVLNTDVEEQETARHDIQWNRIVEFDLVPHPSVKSPEIVAMDFGMVNNQLRIQARAAVVGYLLRRWFVDCSPDHKVSDPACSLSLKDPLVLYGVESASLAPGYIKPS